MSIRWKRGLVMILAGVVGVNLLGQVTAAAPRTTDQFQVNLQKALDTAPRGLRVSDYVDFPKITAKDVTSSGNDILNSSNVVSTTNPNIIDDKTQGTGTDAIVVTKGSNTDDRTRFGSFWSKVSSENGKTEDYRFDMDQDQTLKAWLHFDNPSVDTNTTGAGEGMAFVLQNRNPDIHGKTSSPFIKSNENGQFFGESLGAFGSDVGTTPTWKHYYVGKNMHLWGQIEYKEADDSKVLTKIAGSALQNSQVIAFDDFPNSLQKKGGRRNVYDMLIGKTFDRGKGTGYQHISELAPGNVETYSIYRNKYTKYLHLLNDLRYVTIKHDPQKMMQKQTSTKSFFLSDGGWHHFTIHWNCKEKIMTYSFDDKKAGDGKELHPQFRDVKLEKKDFNMLPSDHMLYWGFTGATDSEARGNNLVVLEQLPVAIQAKADVKITFPSETTSIDGLSAPKGNQIIKIAYNVQQNGKGTWHNPIAHIMPPERTKILDASIVYPGKSQENQNSINLKELTSKSNELNIELNDLGQNEKAGQSAQIILTGKLDNPSQETTISSATSTFNGKEALVSTQTPKFKLQHRLQKINLKFLNTKDDTWEVQPKQSLTIMGQLTFDSSQDNNIKDFSHIQLAATINQKSTINIGKLDLQTGKFNIPIQSDKQLRLGDNRLEVTAKSTDKELLLGNSNTVSVAGNIHVGELAFKKIPDQLQFDSATQSTKFQYVGTGSQTPDVVVSDTRLGTRHWQLSVEIEDKFINYSIKNQKPLACRLAYFAPSISVDNTDHSSDGSNDDGDGESEDDTSVKTKNELLFHEQIKEQVKPHLALKNLDSNQINPDGMFLDHKKENNGNEVVKVSSGWGGHTGLMLGIPPNSLAGNYSGTLLWTLADVPFE